MGQTSTSWAGARVVDAARSHIKINDKDSLYHSDKLHMAPSGYERWAAWLGTAVNSPNTGCLQWLSCKCAEYGGPIEPPSQYGDAYNHPHEATYACAAADQANTGPPQANTGHCVQCDARMRRHLLFGSLPCCP